MGNEFPSLWSRSNFLMMCIRSIVLKLSTLKRKPLISVQICQPYACLEMKCKIQWTSRSREDEQYLQILQMVRVSPASRKDPLQMSELCFFEVSDSVLNCQKCCQLAFHYLLNCCYVLIESAGYFLLSASLLSNAHLHNTFVWSNLDFGLKRCICKYICIADHVWTFQL